MGLDERYWPDAIREVSKRRHSLSVRGRKKAFAFEGQSRWVKDFGGDLCPAVDCNRLITKKWSVKCDNDN